MRMAIKRRRRAAKSIAPGTPLVLRTLATGQDATFGSVSEMAWQDNGSLLALAITIEGGVGNSLQLFDTASGVLRTLDSSAHTYSGLAWRKESKSFAALRSEEGAGREGPTHTLLAWTDVTSGKMLALNATSTLAADLRIVRFRAPQWSEDGQWVYVGVGPWQAKASADAVDRSRRVVASSTNPDELPDVQVWHPKDTIVMPKQKLDARRDRERSMLAAWSIADSRLVRIAQAIGEEATPIKRSARALVVDTNAFAMERSIGRISGNAWAVDLASGKKTDVGQRIDDHTLQTSPGGKYAIYLKADQFWTVELSTGKQTNITGTIATSFVDKESDDTGDHKPAFGIGGWTKDDQAVLLYDKLDIWEVKPDGTGATKLTNGAAGEVRHRLVRLDRRCRLVRPLEAADGGPVRFAIEEIRLREHFDRRVTVDDVTGDARQARRSTGEGEESRPVRVFSTGLRRLAGLSCCRSLTRRRQAHHGDQSVHGRVCVGPFHAHRIQEQARRAAAGNADLSGRLYARQEVSDGRLHVREAVGRRSSVLDAIRARLLQRRAFSSHGYFYLQPDIVFRPRDPGSQWWIPSCPPCSE